MRFNFKNLFGLPANDVKSSCVVMPFVPTVIKQQFNLSSRFNGKPYASYQADRFTVMESRMGPLFNGDAVLALKDTPCRQIIFIGSCGSINQQTFPVGSIVKPSACFVMESFTKMITDAKVEDNWIEAKTNLDIMMPDNFFEVRCASVGSIMLEKRYHDVFVERKIDVIEMECASLFAAANEIDRSVLPLLYVTDIIGQTSPYEITDNESLQRIQEAQVRISDFILKNLN